MYASALDLTAQRWPALRADTDAARLFDPQASYGSAAEMTERVLSARARARGNAP